MYTKITTAQYMDLGKRIFKALGFSDADSRQITDVLLTADLFGVESHGISRIMKYYNLLKENIVNKYAVPKTVFETPISSVIDAESAMGQIVSVSAMDEAIRKAKVHGIGLVQVRNSNHYGIAGYYALMAAREGLIGISMTNTVAIMVPTFSAEAVLGSNPIAVAVPSDGDDPFLFDGATTVVTRGKIELYKKLEKKLPSEWAVDEEGSVSYDPIRILECIGEKRGGGILPVGGDGEEQSGYKGYGFSMICEIMTSVLSGGAASKHKTDKGDTSHCFYAIDPALFGDPDGVKQRMSEMIDEIHSAKKAKGQDHIFVPGEKEFLKAEERKRTGIPISNKTMSEIGQIIKELGINMADEDILCQSVSL
ncbi:Malate/lactate/ureidoglycolate dehydrogenase, LDH2 family [Lachnospiraceae bacterium]|nr:Malate/lactate/ureidoglycolate dehydrogenase, LDH2 family [Lachnospiraceae bacterium]